MNETIAHTGKIISINEKTILVNVIALSACMSCKSQKMCGISEKKDKIIEVPNQANYTFSVGDSVEVETKESNAFLAVLLAYILPSLLLVSTLIAGVACLKSEVAGILLCLGTVGIYYWILSRFKNVFAQKIKFSIK